MTPQQRFRLKQRAEREAAGGFEQSLPIKVRPIPYLQEFLKKQLNS